MMSAIEAAGTSGYQPAQLLNWVYMSLRDAQGGAFEGLRAEPDASTRDVNVISKRGAADLSSNYLNNFFHLRGEVVSDKQSGLINSLIFFCCMLLLLLSSLLFCACVGYLAVYSGILPPPNNRQLR